MNLLELVDSSHATGDVKVLRGKDELRAALEPARREGSSIGLVPTMGYLHEGHLSLLASGPGRVRRGRDEPLRQPDPVRARRGPRPLPARRGARPASWPPRRASTSSTRRRSRTSIPDGFATHVAVDGDLTEVLDGDRSRRGPEHFRGVTTVVAKLFNSVGPDVAYFGQKDAQQAAVIRRMVRDLDFPLRIEVLPTVREPDGLAMSSRNAYLDPSERQRATALSRALRAAERDAPSEGLGAGSGGGPARAAGGRDRARVPGGARRRRPFPRHRAGRPAGADRDRRPGRWRSPDRQRPDRALNP